MKLMTIAVEVLPYLVTALTAPHLASVQTSMQPLTNVLFMSSVWICTYLVHGLLVLSLNNLSTDNDQMVIKTCTPTALKLWGDQLQHNLISSPSPATILATFILAV